MVLQIKSLGEGLSLWAKYPSGDRASSYGGTHKVKLVMKAVLGSSTSKETSLAVSARLTALVVTTL